MTQRSDIDEESLVGEPASEVPLPEPDDHCNGRKLDKSVDVGNADESAFRGYCDQPSGWGTDNPDGRCKLHAGGSTGPGNTDITRSNGEKHGIDADPKRYAEDLPDTECDFVDSVAGNIIDRKQRMHGNIDYLDRVIARRIAIRMHIASKASEYVQDEGLIETIWTEDGQISMQNRLIDELRRYDKSIVEDLQSLGLLDDPESQKADAIDRWRDFIEGDDVIDV